MKTTRKLRGAKIIRELSIIFDGDSVRAVLDGHKTQIRERIAHEDKNDTPHNLYLHGKEDGEFINAKDSTPYGSLLQGGCKWVMEYV
jgi:hypothetical protein